MKHLTAVLFAMLFIGSTTTIKAQFNPEIGCVTTLGGECLPNAILSAMPFLRIVPDARAGAMGDVGVATSPDPNAMHFNSSKLAFVEENSSFSATYTPWLRNLGLQDVYLTYLSGYKKVDDLATLGFGLRFFSLGEISFTDTEGNSIGSGYVQPDGWAGILIRRRLLDLLGQKWPADVSEEAVIFEVSQKIL